VSPSKNGPVTPWASQATRQLQAPENAGRRWPGGRIAGHPGR
jgi:hypothetical protein